VSVAATDRLIPLLSEALRCLLVFVCKQGLGFESLVSTVFSQFTSRALGRW
jgi:hypothetical protein